jgi:hypothetical protein
VSGEDISPGCRYRRAVFLLVIMLFDTEQGAPPSAISGLPSVSSSRATAKDVKFRDMKKMVHRQER